MTGGPARASYCIDDTVVHLPVVRPLSSLLWSACVPSPRCCLACVLAAATPAATGSAGDPDRPGRRRDDRDPRGQQTSDGVRGEIAAPLPRWMREPGRTRHPQQVAGRARRQGDDLGRARRPRPGPLPTCSPSTCARKGLQVDYTNDGAVRRTAPLSTMLARNKHVVGGVNGDFFDIGDTGAPLGVGRDRQRGPLNGPRAGWNNAFFIDRHGHPADRRAADDAGGQGPARRSCSPT